MAVASVFTRVLTRMAKAQTLPPGHGAEAHHGKVGKVMHEFKHGALHSGTGKKGKKGKKVTSRDQAIAIGLSEAREAGEDVKPLRKGVLGVVAAAIKARVVQQPGARGGRGYQTRSGKWRYGAKPAGKPEDQHTAHLTQGVIHPACDACRAPDEPPAGKPRAAASSEQTKLAVRRDPGTPMGQPGKLHLQCPCGTKVPVASGGGDVQCASCKKRYTSSGYVVKAHVDAGFADCPACQEALAPATCAACGGRFVKGYVGFGKLTQQIASRGKVRCPKCVAAAIGRKKYGKTKMARAAAHGTSLRGAKPLAKSLLGRLLKARAVKEPGKKGGKGYHTRSGKWRYGTREGAADRAFARRAKQRHPEAWAAFEDSEGEKPPYKPPHAVRVGDEVHELHRPPDTTSSYWTHPPHPKMMTPGARTRKVRATQGMRVSALGHKNSTVGPPPPGGGGGGGGRGPDSPAVRQGQAERAAGTPEQWGRVRSDQGGDDRSRRRAEAAVRNARDFGTDPSWYGY